MGKPVEAGLKKGMTRIGNFLERMIGQAQKAKKTVETRSGIKPVLSLEGRFAMERLRELIDTAADRLIASSIPQVSGKTVAEIGQPPLRTIKALAAKKPKLLCGFLVGDGAQNPEGPEVLLSRGSFKTLPFEDQFFDWVVMRLASPLQGDVVQAFKELGRVLSPNGAAVVLDYHPYGLFSKSGNPRLRGVESTIRGVEDYYKICRMAQLIPVDLKEVFIDDSMRGIFTTAEELAGFRDVKGTPLLICFHVRKTRPTE